MIAALILLLGVNFAHLAHLTERIVMDGDTVAIVHVYANYPSYDWVQAADAGEEGIACVDDAARAAVLYLRDSGAARDETARTEAKLLLKFVMKMQAPDGMFYNFIRGDHSINTTGRTSVKSFGWWGARALWAISAGARILKKSDPGFAAELRRRAQRTFPQIDSLLSRYGKYRTAQGCRIPRWLPYESGADVTSELMLGLIEYERAFPSRRVKSYLRKFGEGLMTMQDGGALKAPYGLHRSWESMWHMWGNSQTAALAAAGKLLHNDNMLRSAAREARGWYARLLVDGFQKEIDLADSSKNRRFEQIAYGVRPMTTGLLRLFDATHDSLYLKMAGLAASWLFGNNAANAPMYDSATGRCFDGIRDSVTVNRNSGAESTIEALLTLVELGRYPAAERYMRCTRIPVGGGFRADFMMRGGAIVTLAVDRTTGRLSIEERPETPPQEGVR